MGNKTKKTLKEKLKTSIDAVSDLVKHGSKRPKGGWTA